MFIMFIQYCILPVEIKDTTCALNLMVHSPANHSALSKIMHSHFPLKSNGKRVSSAISAFEARRSIARQSR